MAQRFQAPPNWPSAPAGWVSPAGWQPDLAWGEWTRAQVAARAGLSQETYGDFDAGRTWPVACTLYRVAER